jgi:hypothetical protein
MKLSTTPDQILQQLDDVIGVWEENPNFGMGPGVTLEKVKTTRAQLETCLMAVQATNRTLTKQIDDRDDCAKLGNEYVVRARKAIQGYFGPDSHAIRPRSEAPVRVTARAGAAGPRSGRCPRQHKAPRPRAPAGPPIPGAREARRGDIGHGRGVAAERPAGVQRDLPLRRRAVLTADQHPAVAQDARSRRCIFPARCSIHRGA